MPITHIFFDLHGTMIDAALLGACVRRERARHLAQGYGGDLAAWHEAEEQVRADWDAYHADLNFSGDDGMRDYVEAGYRIIRALFRGAGVREPAREEIHRLARELPGIAPLTCDAFYPDVKPVIRQLAADGYVLGVTTHSLATHAAAVLIGGGVRDAFQGPLIGADTAEQFDKDTAYYALAVRRAQGTAAVCLVVDDAPRAIEEAKSAGLRAILLAREAHATASIEADAIIPDFTALREIIRGWNM